ncbi:MAG TPA: GerAB/ArcD/ProY family transporter [Lachnospiraceae bacterium]|nr:GerAB/ArcD/ProY family transporter [Lachnospiraceae bacterium]
MKKVLTYRQLFYIFLVVSITPIITYIPSQLMSGVDVSSIISIGLSLVAIIPLAFTIVIFMQAYKGQNLYEILTNLIGKIGAKIVLILYLIWAIFSVAVKGWQYTLNIQASIMPFTKENFFFIVMVLLVMYAFLRGLKTIFRIAEFILVPMLIVLGIYILSSVSTLRLDYIMPSKLASMNELSLKSGYVLAVAGNLFLFLFYTDSIKEHKDDAKEHLRYFGTTIITFIAFSVLITIVTVGLAGPHATKALSNPFYVAMKGISVLNVLERFESVIVIITFLSDFAIICLYVSIIDRCLRWIFHVEDIKFISIPLAVFLYYFAFFLCNTQFEVEYIYTEIMVKWNLIVQFIVPFLMLIIYYIKVKLLQKK